MIWCLGESLYDIVFQGGQPVWAVPGGSMLNAAVSAARYGEPVTLITELGNDETGKLISDFLQKNGIDTSRIHYYTGNTTLALAFLNEKGDAQYEFYAHLPEEAPDFTLPDFKPGDILLFGSFYAVNKRNRRNTDTLLHHARQSGVFIYYDPNVRKSHLPELETTLTFYKSNISKSDLVRGSDEDFSYLAGAESGEAAFRFVKACGCNQLIYTRNSAGTDLFTTGFSKHFEARELNIVSTIGAGDSFNAGFVSAIHQVGKNELDENFWDVAIGRAVIFASEVCCSRENFISKPANNQQA